MKRCPLDEASRSLSELPFSRSLVSVSRYAVYTVVVAALPLIRLGIRPSCVSLTSLV